jgi:hypothetical protein
VCEERGSKRGAMDDAGRALRAGDNNRGGAGEAAMGDSSDDINDDAARNHTQDAPSWPSRASTGRTFCDSTKGKKKAPTDGLMQIARVVNDPGWAKQELPITGSLKRAPRLSQEVGHSGSKREYRVLACRNERDQGLLRRLHTAGGLGARRRISSECRRRSSVTSGQAAKGATTFEPLPTSFLRPPPAWRQALTETSAFPPSSLFASGAEPLALTCKVGTYYYLSGRWPLVCY